MIELSADSALATSVDAGLWGVAWILLKLGLSKLVVNTLSLELDGDGVVLLDLAILVWDSIECTGDVWLTFKVNGDCSKCLSIFLDFFLDSNGVMDDDSDATLA